MCGKKRRLLLINVVCCKELDLQLSIICKSMFPIMVVRNHDAISSSHKNYTGELSPPLFFMTQLEKRKFFFQPNISRSKHTADYQANHS
jgi:hypothetical protein